MLINRDHDYEATILARLAQGPIRRRKLLSGCSGGLREAYKSLVADSRVEEFHRPEFNVSGAVDRTVFVGLRGCEKPAPRNKVRAPDVRCLVKAGYSEADAKAAILATDYEGLLRLLKDAIETIESNPDPRRLFRRGRPHKNPVFNVSTCRKEMQKASGQGTSRTPNLVLET